MFLNDNLEAVAFAAHLCDELGLDTISCGTTIAFACYLMEHDKLTPKEAGMQIDWGNPDVQIDLIKQIAARNGFGDVLAEGTRALGERYKATELAVHVKGLENACWGVRAQFGNAAMYATSPRGGCHLDADIYWVLSGQVIPELGIDADDPLTDEGMGKLVALTQNWRMVTNSLIICIFATYSPAEIAQMYSLVTGHDISAEELMLIGERIITLKRLINLKLGFTAKDDTLSPHLLKPLEGPTDGRVPNLEKQLNEYYAFRNWDRKTGRPSAAALKKVGLADL
jgi:aldehyde:ferredoxin oxidoreductase